MKCEIDLVRKIESALMTTFLLNTHERAATLAYHLQAYKEEIQAEQR